jgi:hypothetical protein
VSLEKEKFRDVFDPYDEQDILFLEYIGESDQLQGASIISKLISKKDKKIMIISYSNIPTWDFKKKAHGEIVTYDGDPKEWRKNWKITKLA